MIYLWQLSYFWVLIDSPLQRRPSRSGENNVSDRQTLISIISRWVADTLFPSLTVYTLFTQIYNIRQRQKSLNCYIGIWQIKSRLTANFNTAPIRCPPPSFSTETRYHLCHFVSKTVSAALDQCTRPVRSDWGPKKFKVIKGLIFIKKPHCR